MAIDFPATPTPGQIFTNTTNGYVYEYDGTKWVFSPSISSTSTGQFIVSNAAPTSATIGDIWVNTSTTPVLGNVWNGVTWERLNSGINAYGATGSEPTNAIAGDLYYNTTLSVLTVYNGATWNLFGSDTHSFLGSGTPYIATPFIGANPQGTRPNGTALVQGDQYLDNDTSILYAYNGVDWVVISGDTHSFVGAGTPYIAAPSVGTNSQTLRPDGSPLVTGDIYIDSLTQEGYYYNGSEWIPFGVDTHSFTGAGLPTAVAPFNSGLRPSGTTLKAGDQYLDTVTKLLYSWDGAAWDSIGTLAGPAGPAGATGPAGADGADGVGVPTGGSTGQALVKASATGSNLLDLQRGGTSLFKVNNNGSINIYTVGTNPPTGFGIGSPITSLLATYTGTRWNAAIGGDRLVLENTSWLGFSSLPGTNINFAAGSNVDTRLYRDDAGILAQRNSTAAQTYRLYNTLTGTDVSATGNYERARLQWSGNELRFGTEVGTGGGTLRALGIYQGTTRYQIIGSNYNQFDKDIYMSNANIVTDTSTGFKIGTATTQKLGFYNATPVVQPTTAVGSATVAGGGGTAVDDATTFNGYTLAQVVQALQNLGILA